MKKIVYILIYGILALAAAGCAKNSEVVIPDAGRRVVLKGTASAGTRTSFGEVNGNSIPFLWREGDKVWVNGQSSEALAAEGDTGDFVFENLSGDAPFNVYYNMTGSKYDEANIPSVQVRTGSEGADLGAGGDFGFATTDPDGNFVMEHLASYLWFAPFTPDIEYILSTITVTVDDRTPLSGTANFTDGQVGTVTGHENTASTSLSMTGMVTLPPAPAADEMFAVMVVFPQDLSGKKVKISYCFLNSDTSQTDIFTETREGFELLPGATYRIATEITLDDLSSVVLFSADGGQWSEDLPSNFTRLAVRTEKAGVVTEQIHAAIAAGMSAGAELNFSAADNHSEVFGNYYANKTQLKSIALPRNITETADGTRGHNITHDGVLAKCVNLETVVLPEGLKSLGYVTFYGCTSLKTIEFPASVTQIRDWAFYGCSGLEEIVLPDGVESLPAHLFNGCASLRALTLPANLTSLGAGVFYGCESLERLEIPAGVKDIYNSSGATSGVFAGCKSLVELILHEGLETIGGYAFQNCRALEELVLPSTFTTIGAYAFYEPQSLKRAYIDAETVGNYSFWVTSGQSALGELTFGPRVNSIGTNAFMNCRNLGSITFESTVCPTIATNNTFGSAGSNLAAENRKIFIPEGSLASYAANSVITYLVNTLGFTIVEGEEGSPELPEGIWFSETGNDGDWVNSFDSFTGNYIYVKTGGSALLTSTIIGQLDSFILGRSTMTILDMSEATFESTTFPQNFLYNGGKGTPSIFEISMPWNIEIVEKQTAAYCNNLRAVILGENVKKIRQYGFSSDNIKVIVCRGTVPPLLENDFMTYGVPFLGWTPKSIPMACYIPGGSISAYSSESTWNEFLLSTNNISLTDIDSLSDYYWRSEL